jgi:hypothetical protein
MMADAAVRILPPPYTPTAASAGGDWLRAMPGAVYVGCGDVPVRDAPHCARCFDAIRTDKAQ